MVNPFDFLYLYIIAIVMSFVSCARHKPMAITLEHLQFLNSTRKENQQMDRRKRCCDARLKRCVLAPKLLKCIYTIDGIQLSKNMGVFAAVSFFMV